MAPPRCSPDPQRQLMIKTKTCQRLLKEFESYKQEVRDNQAVLDKMIADGRDFYDVKKFREVLGESEMMVPDSENRLRQAVQELRRFLSDHAPDYSLSEGEWYAAAQRFLADYVTANPNEDGKSDSGGRIQTDVADLAPDEIF